MNPRTSTLALKEAPQARAIQEKPRAPWTNGSTLTTGLSAAPWLRAEYRKHVPMLAAAMGVSVTETTEKKEKPAW